MDTFKEPVNIVGMVMMVNNVVNVNMGGKTRI